MSEGEGSLPPAPLGPEGAAPAGPGPKGISAGSAVTGVFFQPGATFSALLKSPTWWLPFLIMVAVTFGSILVVTPKIDMDRSMREAMEKRAEKTGQTVSQEQVQRATEMSKKFTALAGPIGTTVAAIFFFILAGILWGGARAFGAEVSYKQTMAVWGHANLANCVGALFAMAVFWQIPNESVTQLGVARLVKSNPGAFLPDGTPQSVLALASSFDIFALGTLALLVVAFRRFPGLSKATGTAVPVGLWALYVIGKTCWAALFS